MTTNNLTYEEFLLQAGVTNSELKAEAAIKQPSTLSLDDYNGLLNSVSKTHPNFNFDNKSRVYRVLRRAVLPKQVLKAKMSINAWEKEIQAMSTCEKADHILNAAESEIKLTARISTSGVKNNQVTHIILNL